MMKPGHFVFPKDIPVSRDMSKVLGSEYKRAIQDRTGQFEGYDSVELVGFDNCGGCGRKKADKIVARALRLKEKSAEAIHLGNCLVGACPFQDIYEDALKEQVGLPIIERTHP